RSTMNLSCDRRQFLQRATATVAAVGCGTFAGDLTRASDQVPAPATAAQGQDTAAMMPIVDTHQHLWDPSQFRLPWIKEGSPLAKSFLPSDYRKATEGLNVVKAVYMEVDVDPSQQV